jgi:hypothetical protein
MQVYSSLFNFSPDKFDLGDAFDNWLKYANSVVVATFPDQIHSLDFQIREIYGDKYVGKVFLTSGDTDLNDRFYDGKLKDIALKACTEDIVIQQDMDERLGGEKEKWEEFGTQLLKFGAPCAYMVQTIDLYKDYSHFKSVGRKWYLHTQKYTNRGPVNFAKRQDGTVDTNKSDGCELIDDLGDLLPTYLCDSFYKDGAFNIKAPHSCHLGYVDLKKRVANSGFWANSWSRLNGSEVKIARSIEEIEKENEVYKHGLPEKWWCLG